MSRRGSSIGPETGRAAARTEVLRRVQGRRRRRRAVRATGAVAVAALGVQAWMDAGRAPRVPVIGPAAEDGAVSTACGEFRVPPSVAEYLREWTDGSHAQDQTCVLEAVAGPEPEFPTDGLGAEQPWLADDLGRGRVQPPGPLTSEEYPVVHVGTVAMEAGTDLRVRLLRSWRPDAGQRPVTWCTSTSTSGGCGRGENGEAGITSGADGTTMNLLVPGPTAVAALTIDGEPVAWQRPRGRTVIFSWEGPSQHYVVTAYDASGTVIADYSGE